MAEPIMFNFDGETPDTPEKIFTVSGFLDFVSQMLHIPDLYVQGEVTGWKTHPTGVYFSLKDKEDGAVLDCYMNPYIYRGLGMTVEDGMEVKIGGMPSIYKPKGRFSFKVESLALVGEGSLKKAYELLKKKLEDEGLFDRKREIPEFIHTIGVITSKTGAVIDDFRKNLEKRGYAVALRDVRVEGAQAVGGILSAIKWFNKNRPQTDILVLMRGGGSLEDLQAFNNELVVREIFGSKIPTICAIGHDRDVPIAQMVSDFAPSTPTAAAMAINGTWEQLRSIDKTAQRLEYAFASVLTEVRNDTSRYAHQLMMQVSRVVGRGRELAQSLASCLDRVGHGIARIKEAVSAAERHLAMADPERNLKLGYSILSDSAGKIIKTIGQVGKGQEITAKVHGGVLSATVTTIHKN
jgi:exodeoxyribonuclease VII large subunit